jgi:hypothetical protein
MQIIIAFLQRAGIKEGLGRGGEEGNRENEKDYFWGVEWEVEA